MSFVPVVPHTPRPSRRAQELGSKLRAVIDEYRRSVPGTTETEIREALRLAGTGGQGLSAAAVVGVLIGLLLLGFALFLRGGGLQGVPIVAVLLVAVLVAGMLATLLRARRL